MEETLTIGKARVIADRISDLLSDCYSWIKSHVESLYKLACENLAIFWENNTSFVDKFIRKFKRVLIKINDFLDGRTTSTEEEDEEITVVKSTAAKYEKRSLKELGNDCIIIVTESAKLTVKLDRLFCSMGKLEFVADGLKKNVDVMQGTVDLLEQTVKNPFSALVGVVDEVASHNKEKNNNNNNNRDSSSSRRVSQLQGKGSLAVRKILSLKDVIA